MMAWLVFAFSLLIVFGISVSENPIVCINGDNTCVAGTTIPATNTDDSFEAFYGIPYAHPPIGSLRFAVSNRGQCVQDQ